MPIEKKSALSEEFADVAERSAGGRPGTDESLGHHIYAALRSMIGTLRLPPNHPLSEKDVALELRTSRTPVREAFIRLAEDGLVRIVPKSGTYVAAIDLGRVNEGVFIWSSLEASCAGRLADAPTFGGLSLLRGLVMSQRESVEAGDEAAFRRANREFHDAIFTLADFPGARELVESALFDIRRFLRWRNLDEFEMRLEVVEELWDIVNAIAEKRRGDAQKNVESHFLRIREAIGDAMRDSARDAAPLSAPPVAQAKQKRKHTGTTGGAPC